MKTNIQTKKLTDEDWNVIISGPIKRTIIEMEDGTTIELSLGILDLDFEYNSMKYNSSIKQNRLDIAGVQTVSVSINPMKDLMRLYYIRDWCENEEKRIRQTYRKIEDDVVKRSSKC